VTSFPPLRQDIAVVVDEGVPVGRVVDVVRSSGGRELAAVDVFDVYRGQPIPAGRKSVAYALTYRSPERTLTEAETAEVHANIEQVLQVRFNAQIRGR